MFGTFFHPKPVGRTRAVAELSVAHRASEVSTNILVVPAGKTHFQHQSLAMKKPELPAVVFSVRYRFPEWYAFVRAHLEAVLRERDTLKPNQRLPWYSHLAGLPLLLIFVYKRFKLPTCHFVISESGVKRRAGKTRKEYTWDEIERVRFYEPGILLELQKGALPIPFRCLTQKQAFHLKALLPSYRVDA